MLGSHTLSMLVSVRLWEYSGNAGAGNANPCINSRNKGCHKGAFAFSYEKYEKYEKYENTGNILA